MRFSMLFILFSLAAARPAPAWILRGGEKSDLHDWAVACHDRLVDRHDQWQQWHEEAVERHDALVQWHDRLADCCPEFADSSLHERMVQWHDRWVERHEQWTACHEAWVEKHEDWVEWHEGCQNNDLSHYGDGATREAALVAADAMSAVTTSESFLVASDLGTVSLSRDAARSPASVSAVPEPSTFMLSIALLSTLVAGTRGRISRRRPS